MKKGKKQKKRQGIYCPYCGAKAKLVTFKDVYGPDASMPDEKIWACGNYGNGCDAYVLTHRGTEKPFGQLADAKLRKLRIDAHSSINKVVQAGIMDKHSIYDYLEISLGFRTGKFHLGNSNEYYCQKVMEIMNEISARKGNSIQDKKKMEKSLKSCPVLNMEKDCTENTDICMFAKGMK